MALKYIQVKNPSEEMVNAPHHMEYMVPNTTPALEPKTPTEYYLAYLAYAISQQEAERPAE